MQIPASGWDSKWQERDLGGEQRPKHAGSFQGVSTSLCGEWGVFEGFEQESLCLFESRPLSDGSGLRNPLEHEAETQRGKYHCSS